MSVLVDTSVWVTHFKEKNDSLIHLLHRDSVLCHELVIGELACGTPAKRKNTLNDLALLEHATEATHQEILFIIEKEDLFGRGCGYIDIALLTSVLLTPNCQLWTLDKRLNALAASLEVAYSNPQE